MLQQPGPEPTTSEKIIVNFALTLLLERKLTAFRHRVLTVIAQHKYKNAILYTASFNEIKGSQ